MAVSPAGIESGPSNANSFAVKLTVFTVAAGAGVDVATAAAESTAGFGSVLAQPVARNATAAAAVAWNEVRIMTGQLLV
jgi:hypothetical protein